jgi:hypothetical protein
MEDKLERYREQTKASFKEVNEFIHTFHKDFAEYASV